MLVVAAILFFTTDDRHVGKVGDARQMIRTAVAVAETGEIGISRANPAAVPRPEGDAVALWGLGMSLAQVPAAVLAPVVEASAGPGASQFLFLVVPFLSVLLAAGASASAARSLGSSGRGAVLAVVLVTVGSPFGSYASSDFSEGLQGALLAVALAASLRAREREDPRGSLAAGLAGLAAGAAVFVKASLAVAVPLVLLPLVGAPPDLRRSRLARAALGVAPGIAAFVLSDLHRFGSLLRGYGAFGYAHPPLDGALRLLVGPTKGILLFFPILLLPLVELRRRAGSPATGLSPGSRHPGDKLVLLATFGPLAALLGVAANWWAWDGLAGFGPRLLVPALPCAAAWIAARLEARPTGPAWVLAGLCVVVNAMPLLQPSTPIDIYMSNVRWSVADEATARRVPPSFRRTSRDGRTEIDGRLVLRNEALASPFIVYPWFFGARASGDLGKVAKRLESPPWIASRPDLVPVDSPFPVEGAAQLAPPFRLSFLGRSLFDRGRDPALGAAYVEALADQVVRLLDMGRLEKASSLAERLVRLEASGRADALLVEALRRQGRMETLASWVGGLPLARRAHPLLLAELALVARDRGAEADARRWAEAAARAFGPSSPVAAWATRPSGAWPKDLSGLTREPE